ncbi:hypothetical protein niasHT_012247 [Heterodera trifolii]|uniref:Uncharacterized protein n=1 Tax=Heterodera trifolii TaxID=157864 RepID=A0ABD2KY46_9BILA
MEEKKDARQNVKRESWFNNHDLVLATLLDPRFKLSPYLETTRHDDYINWLISEAEKLAMNENQLQESPCHETDRCEGVGVFDIFADFENSQTAESELFDTTSPIPTVAEITVRQKAEFEVFAYLDPKIVEYLNFMPTLFFFRKSYSFWMIP